MYTFFNKVPILGTMSPSVTFGLRQSRTLRERLSQQ